MADPRSYAGTVLPSGGVDPLKMMAQLQAQKKKQEAAAQKGTAADNEKLSEFDLGKAPLLWRDNEEISAGIKAVRDYMAENPNWMVVGSPEREKVRQMRGELNQKMITSQKDREFMTQYLQSKPSAPFREDYVEEMEAWANTPLAQRFSVPPPIPRMTYDWKGKIKEGPGSLPPEEWGWERPDPTGTMIEGASGKSLSLSRIKKNLEPYLSDPNVMGQAEFEAQRKAQKEPEFAARAKKNGLALGEQLVVDYGESFAFGGGKRTLDDNPNVSYGAQEQKRANLLIEDHFGYVMGKSDKYADQSKVVTLPDGSKANAKVSLVADNYIGQSLGDDNGEEVTATGIWVFVPDQSGRGGTPYMEGRTKGGRTVLVEQDPRNQRGNLLGVADFREINASAVDDMLEKRNAFDRTSGTTRIPSDMVKDVDTKQLAQGGRIVNEKGTIQVDEMYAPKGHVVQVDLDYGVLREFDAKGKELPSVTIPSNDLDKLRAEAQSKGWWKPKGAFVPGGKTQSAPQSGGPFIPGKQP